MSVIAHISYTVFVVYLGVYVGSCTHKYDESGESVHLYVCACSGACMLTCVHTLCAYVLMHVDKCIHVEFRMRMTSVCVWQGARQTEVCIRWSVEHHHHFQPPPLPPISPWTHSQSAFIVLSCCHQFTALVCLCSSLCVLLLDDTEWHAV